MEEKILELLKKEMPDIDFKSSEHLVDDGDLDSVLVIDVMDLLNNAFDIEIPFNEIKEENFNSVTAMVNLIKRLKK